MNQFLKAFYVSVLSAVMAFAQNSVTVVNTVAELLNLTPVSSRPVVRVLGGSTQNDGDGADVIYRPTSTASTNTWGGGGPIAHVYGAASGRWFKLTNTVSSAQIYANEIRLNGENPSSVVVMDNLGNLGGSAVAATALTNIIGGTSSFQTQLNNKLGITTPLVSGELVIGTGASAVGPSGMTLTGLTNLLASGNSNIVTFDSMAQFRSYVDSAPANYAKIVYLTQYHSNLVGGGYWYLSSTNNFTTNRAILATPWGAATGRYLPKFENGRISPERFGCISGVTDDNAFHDAFNLQQNDSWPDKILALGAAQYQITTRLVQQLGRKLIVRGVGKNPYAPWDSCSLIRMMSSDEPIFIIGGTAGEMSDFSMEWSSLQDATETNSICFWTTGATNGYGTMFAWNFNNIAAKKGARMFYHPSSSGNSPNNSFDNIRCIAFSIGAGYFGGSGTMNHFSNWYVQGGATTEDANITNFTCPIGTVNGTAWLDSVPSNFFAGNYVSISGLNSRFNGQFVVKSFTNATKIITFDYVSNPNPNKTITSISDNGGGTVLVASASHGFTMGDTISIVGSTTNYTGDFVVDSASANSLIITHPYLGNDTGTMTLKITDTNGVVLNSNSAVAAEPQMFFGGGFEWALNGGDFELQVGTTTPNKAIGILNQGDGTIDNVHFEYYTPQTNSYIVLNQGGTLVVNQGLIANIGLQPGLTLTAYKNENLGSTIGYLRVLLSANRDIADIGGTFYVSTNTAPAGTVTIDAYSPRPTARANAKSIWYN